MNIDLIMTDHLDIREREILKMKYGYLSNAFHVNKQF